MGLIRAIQNAASGVMADQWKEFFTCDALSEHTLVARGHKETARGSSNTKGTDNVISNGSSIDVADGQCMIIVEQGKVVELCAEPGQYTYDQSTEPSLLTGQLSKSIPQVFANIGKRFTYGGQPAKDQRVYYFNTKELIGNKYGTPSPVPFRVVDRNVGLDVDIAIRCFGEYSYRITNPILFYTNVCGNVEDTYDRSEIDGQLKSEFLTALQPAFARISEMGIRYSAIPGHTAELAQSLNEILSKKWAELRGIEVVSIGVSSVKASEEDEKMIKELQRNAALRNPTMAGATLTSAQAQAMQDAAKNQNAGPAMAFMGMGMAQNMGGTSAQSLYQMGQQQAAQGAAPAGGAAAGGGTAAGGTAAVGGMASGAAANTWTCSKCGHTGNTGKFCAECGNPRTVAGPNGWTCPKCGTLNKGKFCTECGAPKPAGVPKYKCDKCGWEPEDPMHPPKFCPQCGDPFDENDIQK